jgi:hypothetical protein
LTGTVHLNMVAQMSRLLLHQAEQSSQTRSTSPSWSQVTGNQIFLQLG